MHSSWLSRVSAQADPRELPLLGGTWRELAGLLQDGLAPLRRIAEAILADPALSLRVLQRANAVPHRHFRCELAALEDAVHMLGTRTISDMAAGAEVAEVVLDQDRLQAYRQSCGRAVLAALLARDWAELDRDRFPTQISLAALLNNLGELFLLAHGDARMRRYLEVVERCHAYPHEAEYVTLGMSLEALGYRLARRWGLPEMVRESMRARNARHLRALCVMLATQVARYAFTGWRHPMQHADLCLVAQVLDLDLAALRERINRVLAGFNTRASRYALEPLPMLPVMGCAEEAVGLESARGSRFCLAPRADDYDRALAVLDDAGVTEPDILFRTLLDGLQRGLGLNRVVIALYDPKARCFVAEHLIGTDFEPRFNRFRLSLEASGLFGELIEAPGALWLNADNRAQLEPRIPEGIRELIGATGFFAASLWVGARALGLVYADRRSASCALDAGAYRRFLTLVVHARQALQRCST
ncbi:HDOD domain-containing protein [Thiocystis violacea]|uniref:HDOD domain-containing protein n=1 Tax=Thiocystis violacea TaxID=13725 RepID=UPI0019061299|nr:HDOD domain-containing protein [Thiocystis violacea]MBK1721322.1 histidine kinase [Thiocystis violacea]